MTDKMKAYVAYTESDLTEGRGARIPIAYCSTKTTAVRLARRRGVQGADGEVGEVDLVRNDGRWYQPTSAIQVTFPTPEDVADETRATEVQRIIEKALKAGLTEREIKVLRGEP